MSGFRLPAGGRIDRARVLPFDFDGRRYQGFAGDTLASALLAGGVTLVGRSFKYHRPRGIVTAGPEEPNALVELRGGPRREPNTPATVVELYAGLEAAASQNRWPSLDVDVLALNGLFARFLPAGFYYKTFMWPASFWERVYEPAIRRAAGLGRAADGDDPDRYEHVHAHCDVLVVGSGAAGLAAARVAAAAGARVILAEQDRELGGGSSNRNSKPIAAPPSRRSTARRRFLSARPWLAHTTTASSPRSSALPMRRRGRRRTSAPARPMSSGRVRRSSRPAPPTG